MILQILGFIGTATLLFICFMLSQVRNTHVFVTVGQDVFRWMCLVLVSVLVLRLMLAMGLVPNDLARNINSAVFITAVCGIVWSVRRHGRTTVKQ